MNKLGKPLARIAFILVALASFIAFENPQSNYIFIFMISSAIFALLGSLLLKEGKWTFVAVCLGIVSVILYFCFDKNFLYKFFIITSLVIIIVNEVLKKIKLHLRKSDGKYH